MHRCLIEYRIWIFRGNYWKEEMGDCIWKLK